MYAFFEKLRKKPRKNRQIIAVSFSLILTSIILTSWIFIRVPQFSRISSVVAESNKSESKTITPIDTLAEGLESFFGATNQGLAEIKGQFGSFIDEFSEQNFEADNGIGEDLEIEEDDAKILDGVTNYEDNVGTSSDDSSLR